MVRPKTILWVDDEVEGLAAHRRFLEDQGFTVAAAAHGDDALALLRRQAYSIVLLDEQMPGRRGLELIGEIRALDPAMPVVMVTQSEDEGTLREAIGIQVDDYLVKPVQPRQILSVITRLLEGDRIRQQHLARDFVSRFRELEGRRGATLAWREWIELVAELARWEVRLGAANEPGLSEALRSLQRSLRKDFAEYVARQYPRWLASPEGDRPPLSVDVGAEFLVPVLRSTGRVLFVLIDTNSTRPVDRSTGTRNSAPTSTESGGRSPSGLASQRGYWRATYSAKSLRNERCRLRRASESPGSLAAPRRTSQRASSATSSIHSRHARVAPRRPSSSRNRLTKSRARRCWRMRSPSSRRVITERIWRGWTGFTR